VLAVLTVSQTAGLVFALMLLPVLGADPLSAGEIAIAAGAGAFAILGLGAFYRGLARGTMSIVAPVAALGVVVPVIFGLISGEAPGALAFVGLVIAIAGVVVLSYEEDSGQAASEEERATNRESIVLALIAALGFGGFFTALDVVATDDPGWAITFARLGGVVVIIGAVLVTRPSYKGTGAAMPILITIGAFDITANTLFAIASTKGLLPVVAVGGSMYPAFTIALAHVVLGERLIRVQQLGVAAALVGVVMIAAGSA
jgi:drug/metabolite transporter (DMT)-like permease